MLYHLSLQSLAKEFMLCGLGCCADMLYHLSLQTLAKLMPNLAKFMASRPIMLCRHGVPPELAEPCQRAGQRL